LTVTSISERLLAILDRPGPDLVRIGPIVYRIVGRRDDAPVVILEETTGAPDD
jgi:hypothetical protein